MPPKRGQRKNVQPEQAHPSSSTPAFEDVQAISTQVTEAVEKWEDGGRDIISDLIKSHIHSPTESLLFSVPLSTVLLALLSSTLESTSIAAVISLTIEGFDDAVREERMEVLGEALVDVVEIIEEDREDCEEFKKSEGMDVDSSQPAQTDKGLAVIKILLESKHLPSHIPNLLLNPQSLIPLSLHPTPHNPTILQRAYVKRNTTLFFRQSKYNLLRESSEGFSRLIVLLTGPDALPTDDDEGSDSVRQRAERVWSRVMGLIGYFNLSPPRVLDVILEIASCHVVLHWAFFLELLRCSPWGAAAVASNGLDKGKGKAVSSWNDDAESISGIADGERDRVLSQVLGFKFGFYQRPEGGETPMGLVYIAALLVKHSFINLFDLLPFLTPDDTEMENIRKRYIQSVTSRSGPSNALANSVLMDDEGDSATSNTKAADSSGPPPKPPPQQRVLLLQAFLAIGHLPSALYFLAKFPWLAQSHPPVADLILRIIAYSLEGVYRQTMIPQADGPSEEDLSLDEPSTPYSTRASKETVKTILAPEPPSTASKGFAFFYPDWSHGLEIWESQEEVYHKGLRWLSLVRGLGGRNVTVMIKLCRIGERYFARLRREKEAARGFKHGTTVRDEARQVEPTPDEMEPWLNIIRMSLLPALSVSSVTAAFDVEIWHLLKHLPYSIRYCLYGEWRDSTCNFKHRNSDPAASNAAAECTREIKKALSRVTAASTSAAPGSSATSVTDRGPARALAKLSHSNPCALWTTAVTQVKAYTNIGQFIIEAGRYMTQLSMDVATFTLVDTLADDVVSRLNSTGTGVALWLESLSTFVGDFNRRYAHMDLEPVLQFIINRLMRGQSADLTILGSLISVMSGTIPVFNFAVSADQIEAYATGREMIREAFYSTQIALARPIEGPAGEKPKEAPMDRTKSIKKSLPRLINALRETRLAMPIWIGLAQTRQGATDRMGDAPLKAMELVQDSCHDVFIQYGDLLTEQLTPAEHISLTPDLSSLVSDYGLEFAMAFQILRPRLNAELEKARSEDKALVQQRLLAERQSLNLRLNSPTKEVSLALPSPKSSNPADGEEGSADEDAEIEETTEIKPIESSSVPAPKTHGTRTKGWWPSALTSTMQQARDLLPQDVNDVMSAAFFVIFWHLQMSDIAFSAESYQKAIGRISRLESEVAGWRGANPSEQKAERARLRARVEQLTKERDAQQALVSGPNRRRLRNECSKWFGKPIVERVLQRSLSVQLHQYCFYPRAILTPSDAVFVAKFIHIAHELGTIGFSTLFAYNNFFNDQLAACIFSCTESEARNFGRCLAAIMTDLDAWHSDENRYNKEALGTPEKPLPGMLFRAKPKEAMKPMSWLNFKNFYAKCHNNLSKALVSCWTESDFMHTKNAVTVALQVIKFFPIMETNGQAVETAVKDLISSKDRNITADVQALCNSYLLHLKKRQTIRPFVEPVNFHSAGAVLRKPVPTTMESTSNAADATKPAPTGPRASSNGESSPAPNGIVVPEPSTRPPAVQSADSLALRKKLEEGQQRSLSSSLVKEEAMPAPRSPLTRTVAATPASSTPPSPAHSASAAADSKLTPAPPAGPRATRSQAAAAQLPLTPSSPANSRSNGQSTDATVPTGPSRSASAANILSRPGLPDKPGSTRSESMGPPRTDLSVDEARAASRARKFGSLVALPATVVHPIVPPSGAAKARSPTPPKRVSPSPSGKTRRSRSVESRVSERTRSDRRDQDDRERARENGGSRTKVEDRKHLTEDQRRQEELLSKQRSAVAGGDRKGSRSDDRRKETPEERERRKAKEAKEKDREREKDRSGRGSEDGSAHKRRRDEELKRRDDEPKSQPRRDDRDRDRDRHERDRRDDRRDDKPEHRRDDRERDRERHRRSERDIRDPRDLPRDAIPGRRRSPERMSRASDYSNENNDRDRGRDRTPPRRDATPKEVLPPRPERNGNGHSDRIIEPPLQSRSLERSEPTTRSSRGVPEPARTTYALPPRPGSNSVSAPLPASKNLASRLGLAASLSEPASGPGFTRTPPHMTVETAASTTQAPAPSAPASAPPPTSQVTSPAAPVEPSSATSQIDEGRERKRPLDESGVPSREESPGAGKRLKIDRSKARPTEKAGGRLLQGAIRAAAPAKEGGDGN